MNRNYRDKYNQQNTRDRRISGVEDTVKEIDSLIKENVAYNKILTQNT